jgi:serine/threonine-protein kinase
VRPQRANDDIVVPPRRRIRATMLPAVLAGAGGIAVIVFFVTRPSPFATNSHVVRDARPGDPVVATDDVVRDTATPDAATPDAPDTANIDMALPSGSATAIDKHPLAKAKPGYFSIDSTPFATIYVDGKRLGITPLVKKPLPAGNHRIRAQLKDGRTKDVNIDIPAGRVAAPIRLTW